MTNRLEALAVPGGRGRAACGRVAEVSGDLAIALRRAMPFLARRRVAVTAEPPPRCLSFAELAADDSIVHVAPFQVQRGSRGLLLVDEAALARILDGVLGGQPGVMPTELQRSPSGALSSAQAALAGRVSGTMLRAFGEVLTHKLGITIEPIAAKDIESGSAVVATLSMEGGGRIMLALPLSVIRTSEQPEEEAPIDSGIAMAMTEVEVDVVAELGKVRLPLATIAGLKVGDVLRLSLPLDERARVSAGGSTLFQGRPTASGEVVAVALERQTI